MTNEKNPPQGQCIELTHSESNAWILRVDSSASGFNTEENGGGNFKSIKDPEGCYIEEDEYNPFQHRHVKRPTSNMDTAIHLLKGNIGTGILAMPEAFKNAGLGVATVGLGAIGFICVYTMHILLNCARDLCVRTKTPFLNFAQVGELACKVGPPFIRPYASVTRIVIDALLCFTQLGFCCVYYVFVATNLQQLLHEQFEIDMDIKVVLATLLLPLIVLNWIRNLKFLTPFIMVGNVFMSIGLGIIFFYILQDIPSLEERPDFHLVFSGWGHLPLYFGTALYAFEGIGMILPLENKMATPQDFGGWNGVLNKSMVIVALLYIAVGFLGYLKYGAASTGSITLNLPSGEWLAMGVRLVMALSIFLSYALQFYIPMSIAWPVIQNKLPKGAQLISEYLFRTVLVIFTFALAVLVPDLGLFITLVGALCSSALGLILPPIFSICVQWEYGYGRGNWRLWKDVALATFGVIGMSTGTYVSFLEIIAHSENPNLPTRH